MVETVFTYIGSPIGTLLLAGEGETLVRIGFPEGKGRVEPEPGWRQDDGCLSQVRRQLKAYFEGDLTRFDLPLEPSGTAFQRDVWKGLMEIPWGETISYGELARRIGRPLSSRAVGAANGANPLPIVIPCHRVIGSSGALTGFGGGIETKRWLLAWESGRMPETRVGAEPRLL